MHNYILFISTEKTDLKIKTSSLCPDDIGMYGIADYIGEELPFSERLAGVSVGQDQMLRSYIAGLLFHKSFRDSILH